MGSFLSCRATARDLDEAKRWQGCTSSEGVDRATARDLDEAKRRQGCTSSETVQESA